MKTILAAAIFASSQIAATSSPVVDEGLGKARQLIHDEAGWRVFRARNGAFFGCFAYKLAEGEPSDTFEPSGSGMALGMMSGSARGFKLFISDDSEKFEYGLFGKYTYLGTSAMEANGTIYTAIYSFGDLKLPQLLKLDGTRAEIEIASYQYKSRIGDKDSYSGYLDFNGLRSAHAALAQCHKGKLGI